MFILKNLNIESKRSKLMVNCESDEAKRTCSTVEKIIWSEANRFDSDFVFKKTEKSEISFFFLNEGQKTKGFVSKLSKFCHYYTGVFLMQVTVCC